MNITVDGNKFVGTSATSSTVMVGWGQGDNATVTRYRTPNALDEGLNVPWTNLQSGAVQTLAAGTPDDAAAVPLPTNVATAVGQPAGTKHMGPFSI